MNNPGYWCTNPYYCRCPISRWASSSLTSTTTPITPSRLGQPDCDPSRQVTVLTPSRLGQLNHRHQNYPTTSATPPRLQIGQPLHCQQTHSTATPTPLRFQDFRQQTYATVTPSRLTQLGRRQQTTYPGSGPGNSTSQPIVHYARVPILLLPSTILCGCRAV